MTPNERIKCLLQAKGHKYKGTIDCAIKLYKSGGIQNFYKGLTATLMRDIPAKAGYFVTYELLKRKIKINKKNQSKLTPFKTILIGGISGIVNWTIAMPFDVAKSRYQIAPEGAYRSLFHVYKDLFKSDGFLGFYKGFTPVLLRAFPANAACFLGYETAMKFIDNSR